MAISSGPFTLNLTETVRLSGTLHDRWEIDYAGERFAWHHLPAGAKQAAVIDAFVDDIAAWCQELQEAPAGQGPEPVAVLRLVNLATDTEVGRMPWSAEVPGLRNGIPDEQFPTWLLASTTPPMCMPMCEDEFARLRPAMTALYAERVEREEEAARLAAAAIPSRAWIAKLLPGAVLTHDPEAWRAPSSWEIRHVVGEGSLTGISGATAARLVGVTPQNWRKYTASEDAKHRQRIGFAMWHTLLHALDIQPLPTWS